MCRRADHSGRAEKHRQYCVRVCCVWVCCLGARRGIAPGRDLVRAQRLVSLISMRRFLREGLLAVSLAVGERLELAVAGDQTAGGDALLDEEAHDRDRSRRRQLPVRRELARGDRPAVGVAVDLDRPVDPLWDRAFELLDGGSELGHGGEALGG